MAIERTFVALKPDAVQRGLMGEIISRFEKVGLKIIGMKMVLMDKKFSEKHYAAHLKKDFYKSLETFMTSGPVIAICLEGLHSVELVRKIVGHTLPLESAPGTIRGDYSFDSSLLANSSKRAIKNLVHASGSKEEADYEIPLWFETSELVKYKRVDEDIIG